LRRFLEDFLKFLYRTLGSIYGRRERLDRGRGRQEFPSLPMSSSTNSSFL
jgi:hypothetical protein